MAYTHKNNAFRVWIETYGCQMNKSDSEIVAGILKENGYDLTDDIDQADVACINTCSVRSHAEQRALGRLASLAGWRNQSPMRKIVVLGCMAQKEQTRLFDKIPFIDLIMGPDSYRHLPELLNDPVPQSDTRLDNTEIYSGIQSYRSPGISGWVTIMRGCDNFCSYCIVPYTRGRERSKPWKEIEREISQMIDAGYLEITLLGQNVNSYHDGSTDFPELLSRISRIPGLLRLRFMTSHPKDCSNRLFEVMASEKTICPHLHLPVQSGSDSVLDRMNRKYNRDHYFHLIRQARTIIPDLAITTDVMVGFPGETEQDFFDTLDLMDQIRFDDAFMYHYSPRPGTAAEKLDDQVPQQEKLNRLNLMIERQQKITREIKLSMIGKIVEVLPEAASRQSEWDWIGKTANNHMVVFPKAGHRPGDLVPVKIEKCRGMTLCGSAIQEEGFNPPAIKKSAMQL